VTKMNGNGEQATKETAANSFPGLQPGDDEISLLDVLVVLAERMRLILFVTAVFAILAIVISLKRPASAVQSRLWPPHYKVLSGNQKRQVLVKRTKNVHPQPMSVRTHFSFSNNFQSSRAVLPVLAMCCLPNLA